MLHHDFGDDEASFEKAAIISNPYNLENVDTEGMKPGWAELTALKREALVDHVVTNLHQPWHLNPLRRAYVVARACATTLAQRGRECEEAAQADLHAFLATGLTERFGYVPVTLVKDITRQSHREIAVAPYAMREYCFRDCSAAACPNGNALHAHLVVWNTAFWLEPEEFTPVFNLAEGQRCR